MPGIKRDWLAMYMATRTAESYMGRWYIWSGDDPAGFDCSGFVIEILQSAGMLPIGDWTARGLYAHFKKYKVERPEKGCLVFVLRNDCVIHVEFCLNDRFAIGANGGGEKVKTLEDAIEYNAFIKIRPLTRWAPETYRLEYVDPFLILT